MMDENKKKVLDTILSKIEKEHGKGAVMRLGDSEYSPIDVISSGSFNINKALGVGGFPRGRITEIYGPESSGKTTLALHAIAEAQKKGGNALFIDAEHALDVNYAKEIGVDIDNLYICQPNCGEQALEIADKMLQSCVFDICVIDSVAALVPRAELEGEMGDSHVGLQARLMSQAMRKLTSTVARSNSVLIFINQLREKVGVMYGNPETTAGGRALKFYASVRIDVRRIETIKEGGEAVSNKVRIKVVKNKVAPPFRETTIKMAFGKGIDNDSEIIDAAVDRGYIVKSGSWYSLPSGERIGQGAENAKKYIEDNPDFKEELLKLISETI